MSRDLIPGLSEDEQGAHAPWEAVLQALVHGSPEYDREPRYGEVAVRVCTSLRARCVVLVRSSPEASLRVLAVAGLSRAEPTELTRMLIEEATAAGLASRNGSFAVCAGESERVAVVVHEPKCREMTAPQLRAIARCASAWLEAEERRRSRFERLHVAHQLEKYESLSLFARRAGHDFRKMLCAVVGHVEQVLDDAEDSGERLEDIILAAREGLQQIESWMTFAGIVDGIPAAPVPLRKLVRGMTPLLRALIPNGVDLIVRADDGCVAEVQPSQVRQLLVNLVSNAAEAVRADGRTIVVEVERAEGPPEAALLRVRDDGMGMEDAVIRRATDPFFSTCATKQGFGLALSLGIARGLGGDLHIHSVVGEGTQVTVILPLADR